MKLRNFLDRLTSVLFHIKQSLCCRAVSLLLVLASAAPVMAQDLWVGDGGDNLWSNPDNWAFGDVPIGGEIRVNGPEAEAGNGPLIEDGTDALAGILIADAGEPSMTMTGGTLELTGWGTWWADAAETTATFNMSGGVVEFTGSPGIMELGWQSADDPVGSSVGIWEMTGGEVYARGVDMPGKGNGGIGIINLWGGTMNVGSERGGLVLYEGARLDVTQGTLVLEGDQTSLVEDYVEFGWMTAYDGDAELSVVYDDDFTTVTALNPVSGDYNGNGELDANDLDLQAQAFKDQNPAFDLNADGVVNFEDRKEWVRNLKKTWIGDSDLNGEFNSGDFVVVFTAGKYNLDEMSGWAEGDWDGNMLFDSGDFVAAFTDGGYEVGPPPAAVPEPSTAFLTVASLLLLWISQRRQRILS